MGEMWRYAFPWTLPWLIIFLGYIACICVGFSWLESWEWDKKGAKLAKKALKGLLLGETI